MNKVSIWKSNTNDHSYPSLKENISVDVAIIGGGITGITAAYCLAKEGKKVAVLEARSIGEGSTGYSTGNLYAMVGSNGLHSVESKWNEEKIKEVVESRTAAVDFIEERVREFNIDCDFKRVPWCLFSEDEKSKSHIEKEEESAKKAGLSFSNNVPFQVNIEYGITLQNQAQFNPLQYVKQLAQNIVSQTCQIFEHTKVTKVDEGDDLCTVETEGGTVTASRVIMATHTPKGIYKAHTSLGPYREYAVGVKIKGEYPQPGTFWDMRENEHYSMRTYDSKEGPILMVLGEPHKVGQKEDNEECFQLLEDFIRERFEVTEVVYKWAAQQYKPSDGIPFIGISSGNTKTYIATGFSADGLTYGTLAAMIISDDIAGKENPWKDTYDAARSTPFASAKEYVKENLNVLGQYLKDLPGVADVKHFEDIKAGEGKVISEGGEKLAAYRDDNNKLHVCSAVCPHMACIVNFNEAEKSWDCPCHGSRFTIEGEVIEGPAIHDLSRKKVNTD